MEAKTQTKVSDVTKNVSNLSEKPLVERIINAKVIAELHGKSLEVSCERPEFMGKLLNIAAQVAERKTYSAYKIEDPVAAKKELDEALRLVNEFKLNSDYRDRIGVMKILKGFVDEGISTLSEFQPVNNILLALRYSIEGGKFEIASEIAKKGNVSEDYFANAVRAAISVTKEDGNYASAIAIAKHYGLDKLAAELESAAQKKPDVAADKAHEFGNKQLWNALANAD